MHKPIHMHTDAQTLRFSTEERGGDVRCVELNSLVHLFL